MLLKQSASHSAGAASIQGREESILLSPREKIASPVAYEARKVGESVTIGGCGRLGLAWPPLSNIQLGMGAILNLRGAISECKILEAVLVFLCKMGWWRAIPTLHSPLKLHGYPPPESEP